MKIKCKVCGDILTGDGFGTFIKCSCGNSYIDETPYYCRIGGNPMPEQIREKEESKNEIQN